MAPHVIPQLITTKQHHMVPHVIPPLITTKQHHMIPHVIPPLITLMDLCTMTHYGILYPIYPSNCVIKLHNKLNVHNNFLMKALGDEYVTYEIINVFKLVKNKGDSICDVP